MAGSSIFVTYGLKSGGGAPFLKRTRNAFGQLQRRTKTASNVNQLQTRTRSCNCTQTGQLGGTSYDDATCGGGWPNCLSACTSSFSGRCAWSGNGSICGGGVFTMPAFCANLSTSCSLSGFSTWSDTSGCDAFSNTTCNTSNTGVRVRECQTITVCQFPANFTDWTDDGGCVVANPACSNGAVIRQCQTLFSFREEDWSAFEEVDECITSSPTAAEGAVAVECIAN